METDLYANSIASAMWNLRRSGVDKRKPQCGSLYKGRMLGMDEQVALLFLEFSAGKLDTMYGYLAECLNRLNEEQVWARQGPYENAVGNLLLHLEGNMRQWILHGVRGDVDVRTRDREFAADGGVGKAGLLERYEATYREAREVIASLSPHRLTERITPQGHEVTVLEAIYQVVGHVQQHAGQIILMTKQQAATDLDLTMPRPRE